MVPMWRVRQRNGARAVSGSDEGAGHAAQSKRADARRNKQALLDAAAASSSRPAWTRRP